MHADAQSFLFYHNFKNDDVFLITQTNFCKLCDLKSFKTCVVVPDPDFPNFSQVVICFQVKLVQAATLKSSVPLQVARSALIHAI